MGRSPMNVSPQFPTSRGDVRYIDTKNKIVEEPPECVPDYELNAMPKPIADAIRLWAQSRVEASRLEDTRPREFGSVKWATEANAAEVALYFWVSGNGEFDPAEALETMRSFKDIIPFVYGAERLGPFWVQQIGRHWTTIAPRVRRALAERIRKNKGTNATNHSTP